MNERETLLARKTLLAIANEIESNGHYQGSRSSGGVCIVTSEAFFNYRLLCSDALNATYNLANLIFPNEPNKIDRPAKLINWNDHTPTVEVLRTLREAAERINNG